MRSWIELYGYWALEATDGAEAVECVQKQRPNLVLIDISLPIMDGITATKLIRGSEYGKALPVIGIASNATLHERALQAGCNLVFDKPVDFESVMQAISSFLPFD